MGRVVVELRVIDFFFFFSVVVFFMEKGHSPTLGQHTQVSFLSLLSLSFPFLTSLLFYYYSRWFQK